MHDNAPVLPVYEGDSRRPTVWTLLPPYDGLPAPFVRRRERRALQMKRGALLVIRPPPEAAWPIIAGEAERWLGALPATPVVLWLDQLDSELLMDTWARARPFGIRACVTEPAFTSSALRAQLSDPASLTDVVPWLGRRDRNLDARMREAFTYLTYAAIEHWTLAAVALAHGASVSTWYRRFQRCDLAPPGAWLHALRVICVALEIQRSPRVPIGSFVERFGFYDQAHLHHRCWDVFGATIAHVRKHLGWEWMLYTACTRSGLLRARRRGDAPPRPV